MTNFGLTPTSVLVAFTDNFFLFLDRMVLFLSRLGLFFFFFFLFFTKDFLPLLFFLGANIFFRSKELLRVNFVKWVM